MKRLRNLIAAGCSGLWLTACSSGITPVHTQHFFVHNHDQDYLQARSIPPLKTPPGTVLRTGDAYVIPGYNGNAPAAPLSLLPPGSLAAQPAAGKK